METNAVTSYYMPASVPSKTKACKNCGYFFIGQLIWTAIFLHTQKGVNIKLSPLLISPPD